MAYSESTILTPLLPKSSTTTTTTPSDAIDIAPPIPRRVQPTVTSSSSSSRSSRSSSRCSRSSSSWSYKTLAVVSGHSGSVSCVALCGEFVLSASRGDDIILWQQPDLRQFARFGHGGSGSVKALAAAGARVFSAHQDGRIRVWKVSRRGGSENAFRLAATLPTARDYLGRCLKQSNYVEARRHHRRLWIEHIDSISCLAIHGGFIYSASWDRTLKVWRLSDYKCLESIRAHDDAINGLAAGNGFIYSASADGKIKAWAKGKSSHYLKALLGAYDDVSWNAVVACGDGLSVYAGGSDGRLAGWEMDPRNGSWSLVCEVGRAHDMAILCLCSMGDQFVCSGSADKSIGVWRRESGGGVCRVGVVRGHEGPVKCVQALDSSRVGEGFMLYSGGIDKSLRVWWIAKDSDERNSILGEEEEEEKQLHGVEKCIVLR